MHLLVISDAHDRFFLRVQSVARLTSQLVVALFMQPARSVIRDWTSDHGRVHYWLDPGNKSDGGQFVRALPTFAGTCIESELPEGSIRRMILSVPVNYKIDPHRNLIWTECSGDVNPKEVSDHFRDLASNPNRPDRLNVLLDLSQMTSVPETDQVRGASYELRRHPGLRFNACAIVAAGDHLFGMMRMFQVFAEDAFEITQAFRTVAEAEAWLAEREVGLRHGDAA